MAIWPFGSKKTEVRAETSAEKNESENLTLEQIFGTAECSRSMALQIPAVSAAINKIGNTIARLPVRLYDKSSGRPVCVEEDRRAHLLSVDPGDALNIANFWKAVVADYYLGKGAYIFIDKNNGVVRSLRYVDNSRVSVVLNNEPIFKDYDIYVDGNKYYPFEFIKVLRSTKNGARSMPITTENSKILAVAYETLVFEHKQVKKGGNKRGFFKSAKQLTGPALESLKDAANSLYNSSEGSEKNLVLNDGVDFKETSATSVELQLNENKRTNSDEIYTLFGFPSSVIRGGATENDKKLFDNCVVDLLCVIESALDKDLLLESEKPTHYFAFDTRELTRGNIKERFEAYEIAIRNHFMQRDEVRREEDLEPLNFNYITLGLADVFYDVKTGEIFVPNTGQKGKIGDMKGGK